MKWSPSFCQDMKCFMMNTEKTMKKRITMYIATRNICAMFCLTCLKPAPLEIFWADQICESENMQSFHSFVWQAEWAAFRFLPGQFLNIYKKKCGNNVLKSEFSDTSLRQKYLQVDAKGILVFWWSYIVLAVSEVSAVLETVTSFGPKMWWPKKL